jgi:hypothetical protein
MDVPTENSLGMKVKSAGVGRISTVSTEGDIPSKTPLLSPGHEAEWAALNDEKRRALTPSPDTPVGELLRRGQHLSGQAAKLLQAVERANGRPRT